MNRYECYTDGAYSFSRNQGGVGIVFIKNDEKIFEFSKGFKNTTNNQMEIVAVLMVLKSIKSKIDHLIIYTDSMYVIGCATLNWSRKKNITLWNKFDEEFKRVSNLCPTIEFKHVKGHSNNQWNNYVDKLAVEASKELI